MQRIIAGNGGRTLTITVDRGGAHEDLKAVPSSRGFCNAVLGISKLPGDDVVYRRENPIRAVGQGLDETYFVVERSLCFVAGVIIGREFANQLGGPIRIAEVAGQAWNTGLDSGGIGTAMASLLIWRHSCPPRSGFSISSRSPCSMGGTFYSTSSKRRAGAPCRSGPRRSGSGSASQLS